MSDTNDQIDTSASLLSEKQRLMQAMLRKRQGTGARSAADAIAPRQTDEPPLLSFAQQRLWFLEQLTPASSAYVFTNLVRLSGVLNVPALRASFDEIVRRHENLRTGFVDNDGALTQVIVDKLEFSIPLLDLTHLPQEKSEDALQEAAQAESRIAFDLSIAPLFRMRLAHIGKDEHVLIFAMHHIIYDGWSLAVLFEELNLLYEAFDQNNPSPLSPLAVQYADYALWQRRRLDSSNWQKQFDYWKKQLGAPLLSLDLPTDRPRPTILSYEGSVEWFHLPDTLSKRLYQLARREDCTLFMVLITAFNVLLHRYCGDAEVLIGTPIAGRNQRELETLIGFFVNTLVIRTPMDGNPAFCDLLHQVKETATAAYANQDIPFESLVDELLPERRANQNPIFQTMFALQNTPPPPDRLGDVNMQIEEVDNGTAVFDLTLSMYEKDGGISAYFEYSTALFVGSTIDRMISAFKNLLEDCVANPEKAISELSILGSVDRQLIFKDWNNTRSTYSDNEDVVDMFEHCVEKQPSATAIISEGSEISYAELDRTANSIAKILQANGVMTNDFVAICLSRSTDMFSAILGVMKAGAAYLPLDPNYPAARLQFMLSDTHTKVMLSSSAINIDLPDDGDALRKIYIEDLDLENIDSPPETTMPSVNRQPEDFAYAIYTSGSTGTPKAVLITHRNLMHSNSARLDFYKSPVRAFLLMSSFSFDSSIAGIFWTLCTGGTLVLPADRQERDIFAVANLIQRHEISHMLCLPSVYSLLLGDSCTKDLSSLSVVCVAGEECPATLVRQHFDTLPETRMYNEYGPTEGTVWSSAYQCQDGDWQRPVPIGKPISNVEIFILDAYCKSLPVGVPGEICIAGPGLAMGYLDRQALTDEKFINQTLEDGVRRRLYRSGDLGRFRSDGQIEFLGRIDNQIKVSGYRIEIAEIENSIMDIALVTAAVVTAHRSEAGDHRLVAYVVSPELECVEVEETLKSRLPAHMLPSLFVQMPEFPLTPNGKIDKSALPDPLAAQPGASHATIDPETDLEKVLADFWHRILEREGISAEDNFFEIGGNSILATRVISRIYHSFGDKLPVRYLFEFPTIRGLAGKMLSVSRDSDKTLETASLIVMINDMSEEELDQMLDNDKKN